MDKKYIIKASKILLENRLNRTSIKSFPKDCVPKNMKEAYQIQEELLKLYLNLNDNEIIGKKVGCTNSEAQKQLDIDSPFYGNLFSKYSEKNGCNINSSEFTKPYFEPEFAFKLNNDIDISKAPFTITEIIKYIEVVLPCIEIVDFRFLGNIKTIGVYNLIASNGGSEYWIKGNKELKLDAINLDNQPVEVYKNKKLIEKGNSSKVLSNPINSLLWIINELSKKNQPILKNYYISTGTCTPAIKLSKGDSLKINFCNIEILEFNYI
tara:strand:- start:121 stop:918 length:798 start_codon:yes stop_codon:yes gene_type:complete